MATEPGCVRCRFSRTVCRSCVGMPIRSPISKHSFLTCNLFCILYQYCPYDVVMASQSRFLTRFISGRKFRFLFVMKWTPSTFCSFRRKSGVSSSNSVRVPWSNLAMIPSIIMLCIINFYLLCAHGGRFNVWAKYFLTTVVRVHADHTVFVRFVNFDRELSVGGGYYPESLRLSFLCCRFL